MKKYHTFIEGRNFHLEMNGKLGKYGFVTNRFIEAQTPEEAENISVQSIREDKKLKSTVLNKKEDPPTLHVTEINELESFEEVNTSATGLIFFSEKNGKESE